MKVDGEQRLLEDEIVLDKKFKHTIEVVVDRLVMKPDLRQRLTQSIETATALAEGLVAIDVVDGETLPLLRELRLPRARRLAARARAAHLLVQRAARRVPALHRPRRAARDRPRPARPRPVALDRGGRARPVVARRPGVLRVGDPGDRRPLRDRPRHAVARARPRAAGPVPVRHGRRSDPRHLQEPDGAQAPVHDGVRGARPEPPAPLPRDRLERSSGSGSRSTCRCARARRATARGSSPRCSPSRSASSRSTSSRSCR